MRLASGAIALFLLDLSCRAALAAEPGCTPAMVDGAGAAVKSARADLVAVPMDEMDPVLPPPARIAVERLKDRLEDFVRAEMRCETPSADLKALQRRLSDKGDAFVDKRVYTPDDAPKGQGDGLSYEVAAVPAHPSLLAIVARIDLECGEDSLLMLYEKQPWGGWRELMVRRSKPYKDVSGAWGAFAYDVSPSDAKGRWYVATRSIPGWCTSNWRSVRYDLSRPGATPDRPRILLAREDSDYLDDRETMRAGGDAFEIRHSVGSIDFDQVFTRTKIGRYAIEGDVVRRIAPVALNSRDFVDEWIVSPWSAASGWSAAPMPTIRSAHMNLTAMAKTSGLSFKSIRRCGGDQEQVEVGVKGAHSWFLMVGKKGAFVLESASRRASSRCGGSDIKAKIAEG